MLLCVCLGNTQLGANRSLRLQSRRNVECMQMLEVWRYSEQGEANELKVERLGQPTWANAAVGSPR